MQNELWTLCESELAKGRACALATVIEQDGSAPRGAGACMLALENGQTVGTVGGGAVENAVMRQCEACLRERRSKLLEYCLSPNDAEKLGMVCGGRMRVHCHYLSEADESALQALCRLLQPRSEARGVWLLRAFAEDGTVCGMGVYAGGDAFAQQNGMVSIQDATALCRRQAMLRDGTTALFALPVKPSGFTYVFGGGHIAQSLAPLLARLDFAPVVFDDRAEFASTALFPDAERVILGDFEHIDQSLRLTEEDCAVIMTRGHAYDHALLKQVLKSDCNYIGLIGSKSKIAHTKALLLEEGFAEEAFARVHTPVGLPIGAETPMEIAVSVAAEMILHRAKRNGSRKV